MPVKDLNIYFCRGKKKDPYYTLQASFNLFARPICHFVGKYVAKHDTEKLRFNKIVIVDESSPQAELFKNKYYINSSKVLVVFLDFPMNEFKTLLKEPVQKLPKSNNLILYNATDANTVYHYFISIINQGSLIIAKDFPILTTYIQNGIDAFIASNYQNKWVHKSQAQGKHLKASIICELALGSFSAHLEILKDKKVMLYELIKLDYNILSYKDDFMLGYELKAIKFNNNVIEIWDRFEITHTFMIPN